MTEQELIKLIVKSTIEIIEDEFKEYPDLNPSKKDIIEMVLRGKDLTVGRLAERRLDKNDSVTHHVYTYQFAPVSFRDSSGTIW